MRSITREEAAHVVMCFSRSSLLLFSCAVKEECTDAYASAPLCVRDVYTFSSSSFSHAHFTGTIAVVLQVPPCILALRSA